VKNFPVQTALTMAIVALILTGAHWLEPSIVGPSLADFTRLVEFGGEVEPVAAADLIQPAGGTPAPHPTVLLEDDGGVLDHFFAALSRTASGGVARVVHYGDSPTTADLITGDVRSLLQQRFGNAGHGFVLMEQPWAWYHHNDVRLLSFGWRPTAATQFRVQDGLYGLGGVTFTATAPARSHFTFAGGRHANFEVWFLRQPGGGALSVSSGGQTLADVETDGERVTSAFYRATAEPAVSDVDVKVERGAVRAFGIVAETGRRGVVYDCLGLNGGAISVLARIMGAAHWVEQLRHRNPDLVVINYGTNEADFSKFLEKEYESELREAIRRVQAALPKASILLMSPMDRGRWASPGKIETLPTIPRIVEIQRRIARDTRCGFFNTFAAMGGDGTIARWHQMNPPLIAADLIHPHSMGAKMIASGLVKEFLAGLARFNDRQAAIATAELPR
jgi:lysophospholipase L1-like esterase